MADYANSSTRLEQAQELAQAAGQPDLEARIRVMAGNVALNQAKYDSARQQYTQALALAQQAGVRRIEGSAQVSLGNVALYPGRLCPGPPALHAGAGDHAPGG